MRLCNPKTKNETGYDFVAGGLFILTPYGHKRLKAVTAFEPGHEEELREELDRTVEALEPVKAAGLLGTALAMELHTYEQRLQDDPLLLTPGERRDRPPLGLLVGHPQRGDGAGVPERLRLIAAGITPVDEGLGVGELIALGVVLISRSSSSSPANLTGYLFGAILTTSRSDLVVFAVLASLTTLRRDIT